MNRRGYILLETVAAIAVLGIGILAVHQATRQALLTRGQARDYTQARFLLEELVNGIMLQPTLNEGAASGTYEGDLSRFRWQYAVTTVELPSTDQPQLSQPTVLAPGLVRMAPAVTHMAKVTATVTWTRQNREFHVTAQTLVQPERLHEADTLP